MRTFKQHNFNSNLSSMNWWIGEVESRNDPIQMGRVQVRVQGYHTSDTDKIPTEALPWASPVNPINSASVSGVGISPTGMMEGTYVVGFWADFPECQIPMVLGTLNLQEGFGGGLGGGIFNPYNNQIGDQSSIGPGTITPTGDGPQWLRIARGEFTKGVTEIKGQRHSPEVLKYGADLGFTTDDNQHPWCAAFTRWCLKSAGINVSGMTGAAKSITRSSAFEKLSEPLYGCIAVKNRSSPNAKPYQGHTGFWCGRSAGQDLYLGGNQNNKVSMASYSTRHHSGYYWPVGVPKTDANNTGGSIDNAATVVSGASEG